MCSGHLCQILQAVVAMTAVMTVEAAEAVMTAVMIARTSIVMEVAFTPVIKYSE